MLQVHLDLHVVNTKSCVAFRGIQKVSFKETWLALYQMLKRFQHDPTHKPHRYRHPELVSGSVLLFYG